MTSPYDRGISHGPREQLIALGVAAKQVDLRIDVLSKAATVEDLKREFNERRFTLDAEQFIMPVFRPLYLADEDIQERTLQQLEDTGIPRDMVHKYLTEMSDTPYLYFRLAHEGEYPKEAVNKLIDDAQRIMFETLKTYLGITHESKK